ncbi:choice-of-anchor B family protein [Formosa sp. S-31]|uniref:choice-of-anchor B family protein n=1 Tax=Formosa sp. S-31 TaxID=2790949 RepID=UPI003EB90829
MTIKRPHPFRYFYLAILAFNLIAIQACSSDNNSDTDETETPLIPLAECVDGFADEYPCKDYDLMGFIDIETLGGINAEGNDCWGWTDPETGNEYAIIGHTTGASFIDITDPTNPINLGILPSATSPDIWRDIKTYNNYAFIVSEADNHGMQVFDLTRLRNTNEAPKTFTADANYNEFGSAHNIVINEDTGYAYIVGSDTFSGGPHIINIANPTTPVFVGGYRDSGYSHDAQVVIYNGPDNDYTGRELYFGSDENKISILDVSDKNNITPISEISYTNVGYTHQGWLTEDMTYFIAGDETDEYRYGNKTRTLIFDFTDLDNPELHTEYYGATNAIDHNGYVKDNSYYQANYSGGMHVINLTDIASKTISETGYFDTFPENNNTVFNGAWSVYPYFESGSIIISDIDRGLFIVRKSI